METTRGEGGTEWVGGWVGGCVSVRVCLCHHLRSGSVVDWWQSGDVGGQHGDVGLKLRRNRLFARELLADHRRKIAKPELVQKVIQPFLLCNPAQSNDTFHHFIS